MSDTYAYRWCCCGAWVGGESPIPVICTACCELADTTPTETKAEMLAALADSTGSGPVVRCAWCENDATGVWTFNDNSTAPYCGGIAGHPGAPS